MQTESAVQQPIIVGTDGSASATEAVRRAAQIAFSRGTDLHIVHGFPRTSRAEKAYARKRFQREFGYAQMGTFEIDGLDDDVTIAKAILEDAAHELRDTGVRVFLHPVNTAPHRALRMIAAAQDAQLIVVGNKPLPPLVGLVRKPMADAITEIAPCEVQVVDTQQYWNVARAPRRGPQVARAKLA